MPHQPERTSPPVHKAGKVKHQSGMAGSKIDENLSRNSQSTKDNHNGMVFTKTFIIYNERAAISEGLS